MTKQTSLKQNPMRQPFISKVTVNMSVGQAGEKLEKAKKVLEAITGQKPVKISAKRTIREWGIHKKEFIACKVTLRGNKATTFLDKALEAINRRLKITSFDKFGNTAFGIKEHIELELEGARYDPNLGIFGMDVIVTFERPGYRVLRRQRQRQHIPKTHRVTIEETKSIFKQTFNTEFYKPGEEEI